MCNNNNCNLAPAVIYVAESPEQVKNIWWYSKSNLLDKNLAVMEKKQIQDLGQGKERFGLPRYFEAGEVLIRHPYDQGYILATEAEDEYLAAIADGIFLMARCLGATKIVYKKHNIAEYTRVVDSKNNIKYKAVKCGSRVTYKGEDKFLNKINITEEFEKQKFTKEQFNKAKEIANERGLQMSRDVQNLIDARNPDLGALLTHQTVNVEISSSLNRALDIAFSLQACPFLKLNSNTQIVTQKKVDLTIEWEIYFD